MIHIVCLRTRYVCKMLFFIILAFRLQAAQDLTDLPARKKICLNMIIKNESEVIEKCLESVKPLIDYWVIVDTGSTDGTQQIVRKFMKGIPGELHERTWVNFEHNRNEALELAKGKGDYFLLIDADEFFSYSAPFSLPVLDKDFYYVIVRQVGAVDFVRPTLLKADLPWKWSGVIHETLDCSFTKSVGILSGLTNVCDTSARSGRAKDPDKYLKDAALLEEALKKDPANGRYVFYLAQSYFSAKNYELALKNYEKRALMPSSEQEETFFAIYNVGRIKETLGDNEGALKSFFSAYQFRPTRAEPLLRAAVVYRKMGNTLLGYLLSKYALTIGYPADKCVEYATYDYGLLIEYANCTLLLGRWQEGLEASDKLLANPNLPPEVKPHVISNCELARRQLTTCD